MIKNNIGYDKTECAVIEKEGQLYLQYLENVDEISYSIKKILLLSKEDIDDYLSVCDKYRQEVLTQLIKD